MMKKSPILTSLMIIGILFLVLNYGSIHVYPSDNHTNITNNTSLNIANNTYEANGITFNYPADWQPISDLNSTSRWGYGEPITAFYDPANGNEDNMKTYFYIKCRGVGSLDEQLSSYRRDIADIGQTEVSERNITVNGMRAVELIKTWQNGDGVRFRALTVHIEAVHGSLYYRIGCVTPEDNFNSILPKFELIVNSFNLQ